MSFGTHTLTSVVARYLRQYPQVEVDLMLSDRHVDLVGEAFDAVFRIGPLADASFVAHPLAPFRLVACAAPAYLRERGAPATPAELAQHECLAYASATGPATSDWRFMRDGQEWKISVRHRLQLNDAKALPVAALDGFGIAFIAQDLAREDLRTGRLLEVLPDYGTPSRPMHLLYHPDRHRTPKLTSFVAAVMEELGA